jgi:hypothetical protein
MYNAIAYYEGLFCNQLNKAHNRAIPLKEGNLLGFHTFN